MTVLRFYKGIAKHQLPYFARILVAASASNLLSSVGTMQSPITLGVGNTAAKRLRMRQFLAFPVEITLSG